MAKHVDAAHQPRCDEMEGCLVCNLFVCSVCGGAEGSLPTECPGREISQLTQNLIYQGLLDFRGGRWIRRGYERWEKPDPAREVAADQAAARLNQGLEPEGE